MKHVSPHERLLVYEKALLFVRGLAPQVDAWPAVHCVRDQLDRACESLVVNLVKAAWHQRTDQGVYHLECSLGSVLECAACLDIARIKGLIENMATESAKQCLLEVARMEVGLRNSWSPAAHEASAQYGAKVQGFYHETLHVYQRGLQLCQVLAVDGLTPPTQHGRYARRMDEAVTSLLLNLAEGNGRFSRVDHRQFIVTAEEAGVKLAAYLDLISHESTNAKSLLREVMAMLEGMKGYLAGESRLSTEMK